MQHALLVLSTNMSTTQQGAASASTSTFLTALVFNGIVFVVEIIAFTILRKYFKLIYEARANSLVSKRRVQPVGNGLLTWPIAIFRSDYRAIAHVNGMDAYFFVRFLRTMVRVLLPIWIVSWAILLPVTYAGTSVAGKTGLDKFTYGNVAKKDSSRYWAHLLLAWISTVWIWWNIKREMHHFMIKRQEYLVSPEQSTSVQATTVLITGVPDRFLSEKILRRTYNHLPGGVKTVWINRNLKELPDMMDRRDAACLKLEAAETKLLATAAKIRSKEGSTPSSDPDVENDTSLAARLVPASQRPSHRLPFGFLPFALPFMGKKVDTIEWSRSEISEANAAIEVGRNTIRLQRGNSVAPKSSILSKIPVVGSKLSGSNANEGPFDKADEKADYDRAMEEDRRGSVSSEQQIGQDYPPSSSAFITFYQQTSAHLACQALAHHEPYNMSSRHVGIAPEDVVWSNLALNPYQQKMRVLIGYAATAGLILLWAIPVAFVGIVSNVHSLCQTYSWLSWLCTLPSIVVGIISGILPPILLAVLMMLLPMILRSLARFEGIPQRSGIELSLMTRFFIFQVIHSFLIVTISSGIIAALPGLVKSPTGVPSILANKLPGASTFFLTYIILQGLSVTAGGFLQIVTLFMYYLKLFVMGSTPRSIYNIKYGARSVAWGTLFPSMTLLVVITLGYSIIAPIINGLACATFFMFYMLYKYQFLWVLNQPRSSDTGGLFFPKALQHIFVGLYVQQICLCALFFLAQNDSGKQSAIPQGALMVVLIICTALFHMMLNNSYGPLMHFLPLSLADRTGSEATSQTIIPPPANVSTTGGALAPVGTNSSTNEKGKSVRFDDSDRSSSSKAPSQSDMADAVNYGFAQPAASRPQPVVWLPRDNHGLAEGDIEASRAFGIDVSMVRAEMNEKGRVDIAGAPPVQEFTN
ncbi:hypothetical protein PLICRDRAFT_158404 [Plicaturopsis crispa FD-325 SS-3]|nr:hypothetical protein PLICRDRAFT_158404 [Plicaturopsis crispa FD-325 SS-3]